MRRTGTVSTLVLATALALAPAVAADEPQVVFGLGVFDALDGDELAGEARIEWRSGWRAGDGLLGAWFRGVGPLVGLAATTDGAVFGYGGLYADFRLGERWVFQPSGGAGGHASGNGKDLGGVFQFHLGAELAYAFTNGVRLGVYVTHISNRNIQPRNPGTESVLLTLGLPIGRLR